MQRRTWIITVFSVVSFVLAACGGSDDSTPSPTGTPAPTFTPTTPAIPAETLEQLERQYSALNAAHTTLSNVWEGLATGQQIQCSTAPEFPAPEAISVTEDVSVGISGYLRSAAIELDTAARLWSTECTNPRTTIPPDIIDQGRLATRAAGDALQKAAALLSTP